MRLELAYVAAFLDCDGTVTIVESNRKPKKDGSPQVEYYAKVNFYGQNLGVICDLKETIGGTITPPKSQLDNFVLQLSPLATVACLTTILPWLRIKRDQALVALQLHEQIDNSRRIGKKGKGSRGGSYLPQEIWDQRRALCMKIRALNDRDPAAFRAFRTNWVNSGEPPMSEAILSLAAAGNISAEGATASLVSPNNNPDQERPARKGRDSLSSANDTTIH